MAGEEDSNPSISDSIGAAIEKVESGNGASSVPDFARDPTTTPAAAADEQAKPERARDEQGKFARKTADTPAHVGVQAEPAPVEVQPGAEAKSAAPVAEADAAPSSWKEPLKAKWATLDPEIKAEIQRRERDISVGLQRAAEARKFGDSVYQEIAPYLEQLRAEGATPQAAIRTLLETAYTLRHGSPEHKKAIMLSLIQQYGIDFSTGVDPDKARLQHELDMLRQRDLRGRADAETQQLQQAEREIEAFGAQPGHEHLDILRQDMVAFLANGRARTLDEAYDKAAWAHPQVRAVMQQQEDLKRQANFGRNRNAAASVTGAPNGVATGGPAVDPKNLRGLIENAFSGGRM